MKPFSLLIISILVFSSCLNNNDTNYRFEYIKIDEAKTPTSFTLNKKDTIFLKYSLPNGCYNFNNVYYEYRDTTRIVAINAIVNLDQNCTLAIIEEEYELVVNATQEEDYLFRFYKGKDVNGENIFEEVIIPVN